MQFDLNINLILHRYNIHELKLMIEYCQSNNLAYQFSTEITERYDNSLGAKDFEITNEQFENLLAGEFSELFMHNNVEKSLQCSCARSVCGISSTGEVYPCIGAPIPSGNLRSKSFSEIWKNSTVLNGIRNLKFEDFKECNSCPQIDYCNRSSGSIYSNTKEYTGCDSITLSQATSRNEFHTKRI
jgi:radical SAM protein with 4Fe4S-binding SPASM domain